MTIGVRWRLFRGKVRRFLLTTFRPGYVRQSLARRRGECDRSGACCQLAWLCPGLRMEQDGSSCRLYQVGRPAPCQVFPIDERDLAERDLVMPDRPCGFWFEPEDGK
jgi:hypothetical protein